MTLKLATSAREPLRALWLDATTSLELSRGGFALLESMSENATGPDLLDQLIVHRSLWQESAGKDLRGFAVVHRHVIQALYVAPDYRRQGIARSMLMSLAEIDQPPIDAFALPGDRATKSLYESIGWKARLLTMRAE